MNLSHEFSVSFVHSPLLTHRWVLMYTFKMGKEVSCIKKGPLVCLERLLPKIIGWTRLAINLLTIMHMIYFSTLGTKDNGMSLCSQTSLRGSGRGCFIPCLQ